MKGAAVSPKKWRESSLTGKLGQTSLSLLEEVPFDQQLVVKMTIGKSQTLISSQNKKAKDTNSALLTIGPVAIDIPQHPIALHGMVTRSSRQLSTTLQELRSSRQPSRSSRHFETTNATSAQNTASEAGPGGQATTATNVSAPPEGTRLNMQRRPGGRPLAVAPEQLMKPIVVQFSVILDSFTIGAALLPSLRAFYQIGQVTSSGVSGSKAKFVVDVREHQLSFNTNVTSVEAVNLPSQASVALPPIHVSAEYIEDPLKEPAKGGSRPDAGHTFAEKIVLRKGAYLSAIADIGAFEHSLTTDLLNHLLLVQKVFMKEVNEVVQKMSGTGDGASGVVGDEGQLREKAALSEEASSALSAGRRGRYVLFSLQLRLKGIQITATTPTSSAVRLETGTVELQVSNRVQNMSSMSGPSQGSGVASADGLHLKMFAKLQVDLNVALGQLIKNALFEEAEPEFQQLAYFRTRIVTRNALQDELVSSVVMLGSTGQQTEDKEAVLITLHRPLLYIQPLALDKAVIVWLNYKNAVSGWT